MKTNTIKTREALVVLAIYLAALAWSTTGPSDWFTWFVEVVPALIYLVIFSLIWNKWRPTGMLAWLLLAHSFILMVGGRYSYANEPLFNWIRDHYHLARNHFDRVGHFAQGFIPALLAREVIMRQTGMRPRFLAGFLPVCVALAASALYEIIEMLVATSLGSSAESFLGSQGDTWDAQWDMTMCLIGSIIAVTLLGKVQNRALGIRGKKA